MLPSGRQAIPRPKTPARPAGSKPKETTGHPASPSTWLIQPFGHTVLSSIPPVRVSAPEKSKDTAMKPFFYPICAQHASIVGGYTPKNHARTAEGGCPPAQPGIRFRMTMLFCFPITFRAGLPARECRSLSSRGRRSCARQHCSTMPPSVEGWFSGTFVRVSISGTGCSGGDGIPGHRAFRRTFLPRLSPFTAENAIFPAF